jgi:hypothetical protein
VALLNQYLMTPGLLGQFLERIREGQAPEKFTRQHLKDIGFKSSNHHGFIPLLKGLGFLTSDGSPTQRYKDYLDKTRSKVVLGEAVRESYGDLFNIKSEPTKSDRDMIAGKFKSTYNLSEDLSNRSATTFLALLEHADKDTAFGKKGAPILPVDDGKPDQQTGDDIDKNDFKKDVKNLRSIDLSYNFQIHLPATKDIEVYNAIFKSLREHILDQ